MSCKKAGAVFDDESIEIVEEVNAAKNTITEENVWGQVGDARELVVASGKKILRYDPASADREEVMAKITGRTGNLRAPALRIGDTYYIGFNVELYEQIAKL